jgi:hypothetical protein
VSQDALAAAVLRRQTTGYSNHIDTKQTQRIMPMKHEFKVGDHVEWNSEAGHVRGTIKKKVTSAIKFKTYTVRASKEEPQYLIKSDKTDHMAMHKGGALKKISKSNRTSKKGLVRPKKK